MVKPVLLVVDDDRDVLSAIARDLRRHYGQDYRVLRTDSGQSALDILRELKDQQEPVALVLSDQRMPGMDGLQLLERIKRRWPDLPVVVLTAFGTLEQGVEAMKTGAADFITKPFDREQILAVIRKALQAGRSFAEAALVEVADHHRRALLGAAARGPEADARAGGGRHDGGLAFEQIAPGRVGRRCLAHRGSRGISRTRSLMMFR